jgi:hypothetical protein
VLGSGCFAAAETSCRKYATVSENGQPPSRCIRGAISGSPGGIRIPAEMAHQMNDLSLCQILRDLVGFLREPAENISFRQEFVVL